MNKRPLWPNLRILSRMIGAVKILTKWKHVKKSKLAQVVSFFLGKTDSKYNKYSANSIYIKYSIIVRKGVPVPLFKAPTSWTSLPPPPFLKCLFTLHLLFHLLSRYFRQSPPPPSRNPLVLLIRPTNLGSNKYQKGGFTSSTVTFYQNSIFNLLNPFTNRLS